MRRLEEKEARRHARTLHWQAELKLSGLAALFDSLGAQEL